ILASGIRRMTPHYLRTIERALKLAPGERKYLRKLVDYCHCRESGAKQDIFQELIALKQTTGPESDQRMLAFFSSWHHAAIFELVEMEDFQSEPEWIASRFYKPLAPGQITESLALLETLDLIRFDPERGRHVKTANDVSPSASIAGLAI